MNGVFSLWPSQASAHSVQVDTLLGAFFVLIVLLSAPVFVLIVVFYILAEIILKV